MWLDPTWAGVPVCFFCYKESVLQIREVVRFLRWLILRLTAQMPIATIYLSQENSKSLQDTQKHETPPTTNVPGGPNMTCASGRHLPATIIRTALRCRWLRDSLIQAISSFSANYDATIHSSSFLIYFGLTIQTFFDPLNASVTIADIWE